MQQIRLWLGSLIVLAALISPTAVFAFDDCTWVGDHMECVGTGSSDSAPAQDYNGGYEWASDQGQALGNAVAAGDDQWVKATSIKLGWAEQTIETASDGVNAVGRAFGEVVGGAFGAEAEPVSKLDIIDGRRGHWQECSDTSRVHLGYTWVPAGKTLILATPGSNYCVVY